MRAGFAVGVLGTAMLLSAVTPGAGQTVPATGPYIMVEAMPWTTQWFFWLAAPEPRQVYFRLPSGTASTNLNLQLVTTSAGVISVFTTTPIISTMINARGEGVVAFKTLEGLWNNQATTAKNARFRITQASSGVVVFGSPFFALASARLALDPLKITTTTVGTTLELTVRATLSQGEFHTENDRIVVKSAQSAGGITQTCYLSTGSVIKSTAKPLPKTSFSCTFVYPRLAAGGKTQAPVDISLLTSATSVKAAATINPDNALRTQWRDAGM